MPRKQKKYHVIYKTTCKVNNKYYVGMHSTDDLDDGYIGSGKYLWNSIRKHGRGNFVMEFLEFFDSREELRKRERELVNENLLTDPMCMNLMKGGEGGAQSPEKIERWHKALGEGTRKKWLDPVYRAIMTKIALDNVKKCHEQGKIKYDTFTGKRHTEDTRAKMRDKAKQRTGSKNSQYRTCWINKNGINKKIKREELYSFTENGWVCGRKMK